MFQITGGKTRSLTDIAIDFYSMLNPINKRTRVLLPNSLKSRLQRRLSIERNPQKAFFYNQLVSNDFNLLEEIITGNPRQLDSIQQRMDGFVNAGNIPPFSQTANGVTSSTVFGTEILDLFDYRACRGSVKFIWLVNELNIVVCPYCNENHTHNIPTTKNTKILHEFDHFVPKVVAPYFSLSFFNLIPSCHTCNSSLKGPTIFNIRDYTHPYIDDLHSWIRFTTDNPIDINNINSFNVVINTLTSNPNEIRKSTSNTGLFSIQERYNNFKEDLIRLGELMPQYSESRKIELLSTGFLGVTFSSRADLNSHIARTLDLPANQHQAKRQIKGKLKMDIAKELKILD